MYPYHEKLFVWVRVQGDIQPQVPMNSLSIHQVLAHSLVRFVISCCMMVSSQHTACDSIGQKRGRDAREFPCRAVGECGRQEKAEAQSSLTKLGKLLHKKAVLRKWGRALSNRLPVRCRCRGLCLGSGFKTSFWMLAWSSIFRTLICKSHPKYNRYSDM